MPTLNEDSEFQMNNMKAFLYNKTDLVQFVKEKLVSSVVNSPWTMTIVPGKFAGYFVYIVTDTSLVGIDEIIQDFSSQFSHTSPETHIQAG